MIDDRHLSEAYNLDHHLGWQFLVDLICDAIENRNDQACLDKIKNEVKELCNNFPVLFGIHPAKVGISNYPSNENSNMF